MLIEVSDLGRIDVKTMEYLLVNLLSTHRDEGALLKREWIVSAYQLRNQMVQ